MMEKPIVLLKSGFVITNNDDFIRATVKGRKPIELGYKVTYPNTYCYSDTVDELYKYYNSGKASFKDLDFIKKILKATKTVFRNTSIVDWIKHNLENENLSYAHRSFLHNLMCLITEDDCGSVDLSVYMGVLGPNKGNGDEEKVPDIALGRAGFSNIDVVRRVMRRYKNDDGNYGAKQWVYFLFCAFGA